MTIETLYHPMPITIIGRDGRPKGWLDKSHDYFVAFDLAGDEYGWLKCDHPTFVYQYKIDPHDIANGRQAIAQAKARYPDLTCWGMNKWGTEFARNREEFQPSRTATAISYLSQCNRTNQPTMDSYALKHQAEHWGKVSGMCPYVSNGELICAAYYLGFRLTQIGSGPDVRINIKKKDVEMLDDWYRFKLRESSGCKVF